MDKLIDHFRTRIDEASQEFSYHCFEVGPADKDDFPVMIGLAEAELILEELYRLKALEK